MATLLPVPWFARGRLLRRSREIAAVLARHGLGWLMAQVGLESLIPLSRLRFEGADAGTTRTQAVHLRQAFGELGATFIKLGQVLSTRADLLPHEYVLQLATLQDSAPPVKYEQIEAMIAAQLGRLPGEIFAELDPVPLASASIGQVHGARLRDGQPVIVKVQRPGVAEQVDEDLAILRGMAQWTEAHTAFGREYNLRALVDEFDYTLRDELDYRREADNAERFRGNFTGDPGIYIPRVIDEYTTGRVLTIERVDGIKISDVAALDAAGIDRHRVAENAVRLMLREVFEFGFFHADPHPGNFFVRPDASIALIDFGMVGQLGERLQNALLRIGLAVVRQDAERLTDEFYALGVVPRDVKRSVLQRDLDHLVGRYANRPIKEFAAAQATNEVLAIALRHRLQLPADLVMLSRVVSMSEGLGGLLDPDFEIAAYAAPFLRDFLTERRSPAAMTRRLGQAAIDFSEAGLDLPHRTVRFLGQLERGDFELGVSPESLYEFTRQMQHMTNRLALSILLAAAIVALGLLLVVYHPPGWEQYGGWVFALAFIGALGFGTYLMWTIWRSGRG